MHFGRRLYDAFFRSYTEKVWGIPGSEVKAEWAAQRIKNFSLSKAILSMLGPGQMWEAFRAAVEERGVPVRLNHRCTQVRHDGAGRVESIVVGTNGDAVELPVEAVLSSIPLVDLVLSLDPLPPARVVTAAARLRYRDLCLVALIIDEETPFPDNWIYLHDPDTRAGRVQNFGACSESMVRPGTTCLGVEYFCFEGDEIWELPDAEAVEL